MPDELADELRISDPETLQVLRDPECLRVIEELSAAGHEGRTAEALAAALRVERDHLDLDLDRLEQRGLVRVVERAGERRYVAAARSYRVHRSLVTQGGGVLDEAIAAVFEAARSDIVDALAAGLIVTDHDSPRHRSLKLLTTRLDLSPERAIELMDRLKALFDEYEKGTHDTGPEVLPYGLVLSTYPLVRGDAAGDP